MPPGTYVAPMAERLVALGRHHVAGRPVGPNSGWGMNHLFSRKGEWSLCREAVWLSVVRLEYEAVNELTWICSRCQSEACLACVRRGVCPICEAPLTDPERSPGGWRHCRSCRRGWLVEEVGGVGHVVGQNWPEERAA